MISFLEIVISKGFEFSNLIIFRHWLVTSTLFFFFFIRISRLKFAKFLEYDNNKAEAEILKRIDIILCVETSVNTIQFDVFNLIV